MSDFLLVLVYVCLPAAGNFAGVALAEFTRPPRWVVGSTLHGAAGVAIALIVVELGPRVLSDLSRPLLTVMVILGGGLSYGLARFVKALQRRSAGEAGAGQKAASAWMVYAAVCVDVFSDGLVTGAGSANALSLGFVLAAAQFVANIPGGFAAGANLRHRGIPRTRRILAGALVAIPAFVSAAIGYLALREASETVQAAALAAIAGLLLIATVEDMVPEGDAPEPPRWSSTLAFLAGFSMLALFDV